MSTSTRGTARKKSSTLRCYRTRTARLPKRILDELAISLRAGSVAIFPTETVYGLGTSVFSRYGIARIYRMKGR
ncbi:MAG TPA: Sua5/YciO/YrdC/YwlC family protein, partial [Elusimicrobiota bacterium]|nr:Sua5/YciO/YrdC/YwlC family protein [Elusimicrobiota bacterium]